MENRAWILSGITQGSDDGREPGSVASLRWPRMTTVTPHKSGWRIHRRVCTAARVFRALAHRGHRAMRIPSVLHRRNCVGRAGSGSTIHRAGEGPSRAGADRPRPAGREARMPRRRSVLPRSRRRRRRRRSRTSRVGGTHCVTASAAARRGSWSATPHYRVAATEPSIQSSAPG